MSDHFVDLENLNTVERVQLRKKKYNYLMNGVK